MEVKHYHYIVLYILEDIVISFKECYWTKLTFNTMTPQPSLILYNLLEQNIRSRRQEKYKSKGSLVHVTPACTGSGEGSDHFGSYVDSLSL
jgi:hypothetical protein